MSAFGALTRKPTFLYVNHLRFREPSLHLGAVLCTLLGALVPCFENNYLQALPIFSRENTPDAATFAGVRKTICKKHVDATGQVLHIWGYHCVFLNFLNLRLGVASAPVAFQKRFGRRSAWAGVSVRSVTQCLCSSADMLVHTTPSFGLQLLLLYIVAR